MNKSKLGKAIQDMQLNQLNHPKKEMAGITNIGDYTSYRNRRAKEENATNYEK